MTLGYPFLRSNQCENIYSQRDGDTDSKLLSRDTHSPYVDNRTMLLAGKPELRQYKAIFILDDHEVSEFSDDTTVNCAADVKTMNPHPCVDDPACQDGQWSDEARMRVWG